MTHGLAVADHWGKGKVGNRALGGVAQEAECWLSMCEAVEEGMEWKWGRSLSQLYCLDVVESAVTQELREPLSLATSLC